MKKYYSEKLKDPRWQRKRLEIFQRDEWKCRCCWDEDGTLHVHHLVYLKNHEPWDVPNGLLLTVCSRCHEQIKEPDEDMGALESLVNDVGVLLDTFWRAGFEAGDLITMAEGISHLKKTKADVLINVDIKCTWKRIRE